MTQILSIDLSKKNDEGVSISVKLEPVVERVLHSLSKLHSLKSHRLLKYWKYREEYAQRLALWKTEDGYTNYWMNTWFAIVNSKAADVITNTPKFDFVALDNEAKKYKRVRELHWQYVWLNSRTDREIMRIVLDALKYWVGFWEEVVLNKKRKVKTPYKVWEEIRYKEETVNEFTWCKLNHIPYSQIYVNWSSIENTTEAITISYWDRDEFLLTFWEDARYSWVTDEAIPKWKYYYVWQWSNSLTVNWTPAVTDRGWNTVENDNIVSVLTYYNKYRDEYIVLANNTWINPIVSANDETSQRNIQPIPYPHKEIPIVVYTDHTIDDDIYWVGEFDITERSRSLKDAVRSLHIEWIKAQAGIITIDPDSDYDETVMKLWMRQVARVEKGSLGFFAPNINLSSLENLERKVEEDLIIETWVDFKSQLFWPNETAARTEWRIAAAKKRINHNIKENAYNFYERLARLRSANIEFFYSDKQENLPVKNIEVSEDWTVEYVQNGYGLFTMKPEYLKGKMALIPVVDSLYGDTSSEKKQKYIETLQLMMNMKDKQWAPLFDNKLLIEAGRWIIDEVVDIDKVLWKSNDAKSPEEIMKEAWITESQPNSPNGWVPPEQQSGAPVLLGSSPSAY